MRRRRRPRAAAAVHVGAQRAGGLRQPPPDGGPVSLPPAVSAVVPTFWGRKGQSGHQAAVFGDIENKIFLVWGIYHHETFKKERSKFYFFSI